MAFHKVSYVNAWGRSVEKHGRKQAQTYTEQRGDEEPESIPVECEICTPGFLEDGSATPLLAQQGGMAT